ncbi:hypothetical protein O6H91_04G133800 [Diphasiastrum complanatum]|uniref:Uncharacterized protein n=1 Tax=Diphasiastrum complanatum TaxID=34168 RepID=A0ACC2E210_DIPCM|nr:hypothetical protein O6H91_Y084100 [Diphasiastrum complanatum]KAJ7560531.1 hypothetical protein O6H91_04G133800 [Diphasiastrum complanatum]
MVQLQLARCATATHPDATLPSATQSWGCSSSSSTPPPLNNSSNEYPRARRNLLCYRIIEASRREHPASTSRTRVSRPAAPMQRPSARPWGSGRSKSRPRPSAPAAAVVACSASSLPPSAAAQSEKGKAGTTASPNEQTRKALSEAPSLLVFSGGTAFNGVVEELKKLTTRVAHVLPVSDDGGSTAEIVRVLGGPAIGDIRSRCLRLSDESTVEALAVKRLLGHRLALTPEDAKSEWYHILEGNHLLWHDVSGPYRETIRAFLVFFQSQILMRPNEKFSFKNGSIGNFFFAGARIFFQSLEAAIFLYSRVSGIPVDSLILPAICTNDRLTIGCELNDGTVIRGQNAISHPITKDSIDDMSRSVNKIMHASLPLCSPIKRIFYMSSEGTNLLHEVFPPVNDMVLEKLNQVDAIVYGMGSLYTSICPSLVLRGVGEAVAKQGCPKLLLLNGTHDRETAGMSASDFVVSISNALNRRHGDPHNSLDHPPPAYVNALIAPEGTAITIDTQRLNALGITQVFMVDSIQDGALGIIFEPRALICNLKCAIDSSGSPDLHSYSGGKDAISNLMEKKKVSGKTR